MPSNDIAVELKRRRPEAIPLLTNQLLFLKFAGDVGAVDASGREDE